MFDVATYRGSVDATAHGFPPSAILQGVVLLCALLALALIAPVASAGSLYRCAGGSGETVYTSNAAGYHGCSRISGFATAAAPRRASTVRSARSARTSLTLIRASSSTTARSLFANGARPTTLGRVQASVVTAARTVAPARVQRVSLAVAHGSVSTDARIPSAPDSSAVPGQWSYRQSSAALSGPDSSATKAASSNAAAPRVLRGAVYRVARTDGSVEYTNLRPASGNGRAVTMLFSYIATCVACDLHSPIRWGSVSLNLTAYADTIRAASVEYGVDEAFLRAIIHAESAFNPRALSVAGAQGLMQLMPGTASDMGVLDAFNIEQNIRGGARYLSLMLRDFGGSEKLAAAAYNAGPGAVQRYSGVPPYAETMVYVERVATLRQRYGAAIHPPLASRTTVASASRM